MFIAIYGLYLSEFTHCTLYQVTDSLLKKKNNTV